MNEPTLDWHCCCPQCGEDLMAQPVYIGNHSIGFKCHKCGEIGPGEDMIWGQKGLWARKFYLPPTPDRQAMLNAIDEKWRSL